MLPYVCLKLNQLRTCKANRYSTLPSVYLAHIFLIGRVLSRRCRKTSGIADRRVWGLDPIVSLTHRSMIVVAGAVAVFVHFDAPSWTPPHSPVLHGAPGHGRHVHLTCGYMAAALTMCTRPVMTLNLCTHSGCNSHQPNCNSCYCKLYYIIVRLRTFCSDWFRNKVDLIYSAI